mmetsp:Transcript_3371/g.7645  ORF Transcript_3371/g.7645 Transcript_3371/m.7645 type:complete len:170 (+) Transcript_3371:1916-2425(+)
MNRDKQPPLRHRYFHTLLCKRNTYCGGSETNQQCFCSASLECETPEECKRKTNTRNLNLFTKEAAETKRGGFEGSSSTMGGQKKAEVPILTVWTDPHLDMPELEYGRPGYCFWYDDLMAFAPPFSKGYFNGQPLSGESKADVCTRSGDKEDSKYAHVEGHNRVSRRRSA